MFEYLIEDFRTYKPLLSAIKSEYELFIGYQQELVRELQPMRVSEGLPQIHIVVCQLYMCPVLDLYQCFSQSSKQRGGGRIEKTTTSKGLLHSNDHIKGNWTTIDYNTVGTPLPSFGESLYIQLVFMFILPAVILT